MGQEKIGVSAPEVIKAMGLYGGGVTGTGGICGSLLGGIAVISSIYSRSSVEEKESPRMWKLGHKLEHRFKEITQAYGGTNCRDIACVDWTDRDQARAFYKDPQSTRTRCLEVVEKTARILGEILDQDAEEQAQG